MNQNTPNLDRLLTVAALRMAPGESGVLVVRTCLLVLTLGLVGCDRRPQADVKSKSTAEIKLEMLNGDKSTARVLAKTALLERPDDPELLSIYGDLAIAAGDKQEALDTYLLIPVSAGEVGFRSRYKASLILVEQGRLYDSIDELRKLVAAFPLETVAQRQLGGLLTMVGDNWAGWKYIENVIRQTGPDLELLKLSMDRTRPQCNVELVESALRDHPNDLRPQLGIAFELAYVERWKEAKESLQEILEKHPKHLPSHLLLGECLVALGDASVSKWISNCPEDAESHPDYWYLLGRLHQEGSKPRVAVRCYWEALSRDPSLLKAYFGLAAVLDEVGDNELALLVAGHAKELNNLHVFGRQFMSHHRNSQKKAMAMSKMFDALGRKWEAFGWASFAMHLREDLDSQVVNLATAYGRQLTRETPIVISDHLVASMIVGTEYPLPSLAATESITKDELVVSSSDHRIRLEDEAEARGISFRYDNGDDPADPGIKIYQATGGGVAVLDFDCNGFPDLYFTQGDKEPFGYDARMPNQLYRNWAGNFYQAGVSSRTAGVGFGQGVTAADLNDDGFDDLLVANIGRNIAYLNNGDGTFTDVSDEIGFGGVEGWSTSLAVADIDGDGYSDIYEANYICGSDPASQGCLIDPPATQISPASFPASLDRVLFGTGNGRFEDESASSLVDQHASRGLGVVVAQLDDKPGLEIFVANDLSPNHFWICNDRENASRRFSDAAILKGVAMGNRSVAQACMGIAVADPDRDGDMDLFVTNFNGEPNAFYEHTSSESFIDQTFKFGLAQSSFAEVSFGTQFVDFDLDGRLEIIVANGDITDLDNGYPFKMYSQIFQSDAWGKGWTLIDRESVGGYFQEPHIGRAVATADVNVDGRTDCVITDLLDSAALLINRSTIQGKQVSLRLVGRNGARDAVGAKICVKTNVREHLEAVVAGNGFHCCNEGSISIALASGESIESMEVNWPSGTQDNWGDIEPGDVYVLVESLVPKIVLRPGL